MAERAQLLARTNAISQDFRQITMPLMRKRLLEYREEKRAGAAAVEIPLNRRQVACCLTYLSNVQQRIMALAAMAPNLSGDPLVQAVQLMENEVRAAESLSPQQMLKRSQFAGLSELLSLYQLPRKMVEEVGSFAERIFGSSPPVLYQDEQRCGIYLPGKQPMEMVGSLSHLKVDIPEAYLFSPTTRLNQPVVNVDYDFSDKTFNVQSLALRLEASGEKSQTPTLQAMRAMAESAGVKFLFLLDSMAAAAKSIGAGAREVQDAVNRPSAYSFVCRTPSYDDEPPSRGNGFRQALFEASLTVPGSADHLSKVVGKVLLPDCEITL